MTLPVCIDHVREAGERIAPHVHRTPVATSRTLDAELGAQVYFKCENLQKVGAFKARGAVNAVFSLDAETAARGVVTHSSGNHGAALAYAARARGIPCSVVMPGDAPRIKLDAVRGYGADIVPCERSLRQEVCDQVARRTGGTMVHPYENPQVIAGQGTAALELIEQVGDLDVIVAPVGGGGLLSGTAVSVSALAPDARTWGAEPEAVDDAYRSLTDGVLHPSPERPQSICDGLLTGLGRTAFEILRACDVRVIPVGEDEIVEAGRFILQRMKLVVEPSAATVLAVLRRRADEIAGLRVGAILSGGNTDLSWV